MHLCVVLFGSIMLEFIIFIKIEKKKLAKIKYFSLSVLLSF